MEIGECSRELKRSDGCRGRKRTLGRSPQEASKAARVGPAPQKIQWRVGRPASREAHAHSARTSSPCLRFMLQEYRATTASAGKPNSARQSGWAGVGSGSMASQSTQLGKSQMRLGSTPLWPGLIQSVS